MGTVAAKETGEIGHRSLRETLAAFAGWEETWWSIPGFLWSVLTHTETVPQVYRLTQSQPFCEVLRGNPRFGLRYLARNYLVRSFSVGDRARCFLYHHRRMQATIPTDLLKRIMLGNVKLYQVEAGGQSIAVTVGQTKPLYDKEGEWNLSLMVDDEPVFVLGFSVVPGGLVGVESSEVVLVSRLQGVSGCYPQIKLARKSLADVAPNALLLAALQGIATALGIDELAVVNATEQSAYREPLAEDFLRGYDDFFGELGITRNAAGFLVSAIPIAEKPIAEIKKGHKLRTKEKRALKMEVMTSGLNLFREAVELPSSLQTPGLR